MNVIALAIVTSTLLVMDGLAEHWELSNQPSWDTWTTIFLGVFLAVMALHFVFGKEK